MQYLDLSWIDQGAFPSIEAACPVFYCLTEKWRWEPHKTREKRIHPSEGMHCSMTELFDKLPKCVEERSEDGTFLMSFRACFQARGMLSLQIIGGLTFVPELSCGFLVEPKSVTDRIAKAAYGLVAYDRSRTSGGGSKVQCL